jgi:hypothetical protein
MVADPQRATEDEIAVDAYRLVRGYPVQRAALRRGHSRCYRFFSAGSPTQRASSFDRAPVGGGQCLPPSLLAARITLAAVRRGPRPCRLCHSPPADPRGKGSARRRGSRQRRRGGRGRELDLVFGVHREMRRPRRDPGSRLAHHILVRLMVPPHRIPSIWNLPLPCDPLSCALITTVRGGLFTYRLKRTSPTIDTVPRSPPGPTTTPFVMVHCLT